MRATNWQPQAGIMSKRRWAITAWPGAAQQAQAKTSSPGTGQTTERGARPPSQASPNLATRTIEPGNPGDSTPRRGAHGVVKKPTMRFANAPVVLNDTPRAPNPTRASGLFD
jgi:hypothetical protein